MTKILCPVDFSQGSKHAMRTAVRLAVASNAELVLAHVWHVPPMMYAGELGFSGATVQAMVDDEEVGLEAAVADARALGAPRVSSKFLTGVPWDQLVDVVRADSEFELVVMGTHGRSGVSRFLIGSVAENVVRHAPCSVLAVHERDNQTAFRTILCPVDFSESSQHATELAAHYVEPGKSTITLLHVLELPVTYSGDPSIPGFTESLDKHASKLLEDWAVKLRATAKVPVVTKTRIGSPAGQALALLDDQPPFDLVIVGSHGRTGIRRVLLGSVAEKIVRHAPCPVLVARRR